MLYWNTNLAHVIHPGHSCSHDDRRERGLIESWSVLAEKTQQDVHKSRTITGHWIKAVKTEVMKRNPTRELSFKSFISQWKVSHSSCSINILMNVKYDALSLQISMSHRHTVKCFDTGAFAGSTWPAVKAHYRETGQSSLSFSRITEQPLFEEKKILWSRSHSSTLLITVKLFCHHEVDLLMTKTVDCKVPSLLSAHPIHSMWNRLNALQFDGDRSECNDFKKIYRRMC